MFTSPPPPGGGGQPPELLDCVLATINPLSRVDFKGKPWRGLSRRRDVASGAKPAGYKNRASANSSVEGVVILKFQESQGVRRVTIYRALIMTSCVLAAERGQRIITNVTQRQTGCFRKTSDNRARRALHNLCTRFFLHRRVV